MRRLLVRDARVLVSLQIKPGHLRVRTSYYYRWCSTRPIFAVRSLAWTNVKEEIRDTTRREFHRFSIKSHMRGYVNIRHLSLIQRWLYVLWTQKFYTNPRQTIAVKTRPVSSFQDFVAPMSPFLHRDCLAVRPPPFAVPPDRPEYLLHSIGPRRSDYSPY